jgi:hypothetical protein
MTSSVLMPNDRSNLLSGTHLELRVSNKGNDLFMKSSTIKSETNF